MSRAAARPTRRASRLLARLRFLLLALFASCGPAGVVPTAAAPVCCPSPVVTWSAWSTYDRAHAAAIYVDGLTFAHAEWSGTNPTSGGGPALDYRDARGCIVEARVASLELADPIEGLALVACAGTAP